MGLGPWTALEWVALVEQELLLFAGTFFLIGALDEFAVDIIWLYLRLTGRARTPVIVTDGLCQRPLSGRAAIIIPAWHEAQVIEHTIAHALVAWPQRDVLLYVGCYRNDPATMQAAARGAGGDVRVRIVVHSRDGPSTKADCLNRLYTAMALDEERTGQSVRMVLMHDAEDMVDPSALVLLDRAMDEAEFVQLPVLPVPQERSRWVGSHYCEEFAEQHGKGLVVREALAAGLPAAGVGCAFARGMLATMAAEAGRAGPFSEHSLTEDYELGLRVAAAGGRSRSLRVRGEDKHLIATRAYFPADLGKAVRQKSRWVHGIALQGWDRLGWAGGLGEKWMRLRDRRGPLSALVLFTGYLLLVLSAALAILELAGIGRAWEPSPLLIALLVLNTASFAWRGAFRFAFTAREYGWIEGVRAVLRIPLSNIITIMAGRRALFAYARTLLGAAPLWDKTLHDAHPAVVARLGWGR